MAGLRKKENSDFVRFRVLGRQYERDVGQDKACATATKKRIEAMVFDIKNGRVKLPADADVAQFVANHQFQVWLRHGSPPA
jgi:hypothetical protein